MIEWEKYRQTDEFKNSFKWAADLQHRTGSMWAAFAAGALAMNPDAAQSLKLPETAPAGDADELRKFVLDHWDNQDMNHADFRIHAYQIAAAPGSVQGGE